MADEPLTTSQAIASLDPVEAAGEAIRNYCDWHISPVLQTVRKFRRLPACLPTRKLISVDAIVYQVADEANGWQPDVDVSEVDWYENGEIYLPHPHVHHMRRFSQKSPVTITFTHGFESTPSDLMGVVGSLTKRAALEAARGLITGPFQIQANGQVTADFNTYELKILEKYRVVPFA